MKMPLIVRVSGAHLILSVKGDKIETTIAQNINY